MKVSRTYQPDESWLECEYDLFICSSGYEERATYIAQKKPCAKENIVFGFAENKDNEVRQKNDNFYLYNNYTYLEESLDSDIVILDFLNSFIKSTNKSNISVLVDYSSMTRCWYGAIIHFVNIYENSNININVTFVYARAVFTLPPDNETRSYYFQPIAGYTGLSIPCRPTALIIGLGYEKRRAFGLKEFFDAEETYIFHTDKESAPEFYNVIRDRNKEILAHTESSYIFEYPINDLIYTKKVLQDICSSLTMDYRVLVTPCGPKPFTLISLIVASELSNIDVWKISGEIGFSNSDRKATGDILALTVEYR